MVKNILLTMFIFAVVMIMGGGGISIVITSIVGGGVDESYIYPLYGGIILLSGLVVGCTCVILEKIKALENKISTSK